MRFRMWQVVIVSEKWSVEVIGLGLG